MSAEPVRSPGGAADAPSRSVARSKVRHLSLVELGLLVVQFLIGMGANLYLTVPAVHPWSHASPATLLYGHIFVGALILVVGFVLAARAGPSGDRAAVVCASTGLTGTVLAMASGVSFVSSGGSALPSLLMSIGFAIAACSYLILAVASPSP